MEEKRAPRIPLTSVEPAIRGIADEPLLLPSYPLMEINVEQCETQMQRELSLINRTKEMVRMDP